MDIDDLHPPDDWSHRFFIWHEWIQANGPLTPKNVLDYFSFSMFYDKQSSNQVLRMQTQHSGVPLENEAEELKRFTGIEFALVHAEPPSMFIIQKRERLSPEEVKPLATYFVMNNRIYQSPDLYSVLSNLNALQSSLDILRKHRPDYTPRTGFVWPVADPTLSEAAKKRASTEAALDEANEDIVNATKEKPSTGTTSQRRQQNNLLLLNAMRTTALHSQAQTNTTSTNALPGSAVNATDAAVDTPVATTRASVTPAPSQSQAATPKPVALSSTPPIPQDIVPKAGPSKKKKKRTSLAAPASTSPSQ
ncbi:hypothetical protein AX16_005648 [Volvariella volvacea WC 439]|nr:hypothetical protein AX16_005648 [Volvariella volvacea WC 439]